MIIALIIGHSQDSKGSYGNTGMSEWDFNDQLLHELSLEGYLPDNHTFYILYRSADVKGYSAKMGELHRQLYELDIDLGIEFHFNGFSDPTVNGNEVLFNGANPDSVKYAMILDECFDDLPNRDRGTKLLTRGDNGFGFVAGSDIPCIIAEPFFGSHQDKYVHLGAYRGLLKKSLQKFFQTI